MLSRANDLNTDIRTFKYTICQPHKIRARKLIFIALTSGKPTSTDTSNLHLALTYDQQILPSCMVTISPTTHRSLFSNHISNLYASLFHRLKV